MPPCLKRIRRTLAVVALTAMAVDAKFDRKELTITLARENIVEAAAAVKAAGI